jgi:hypothetical protein
VSGVDAAKLTPADNTASKDPAEQDALFKQFLVWDKQRAKKP